MEARAKRTRTCIGCGAQSDKVELMRLVRTDAGVKFDATGRVPGRGAYVCSRECLDKAIAARKLQRALRCGIEQEEFNQIKADMDSSALVR